ncbi:hypothetical protein TA3x_005683 [Tundrisphaera sp. TA3]|uniref:hypothetical protein n=1 Tax=Tundrisphaera sp. TA3 TaxID=3435775 RepID=UPI003EB7EACC
MKYSMSTKFWHDEDDAGLLSRLERLFEMEFFQGTVLRPRSDRLPPTRANLHRVLQPDRHQTSDVRFVVDRGKKSLRGELSIIRNSEWTASRFTSSLGLDFSLSECYKGGPFHGVDEIRDLLLACVQVGPSAMGFVKCEDESSEQHSANFERFRNLDSMAVPVTIEWVTVLHKDVVAAMEVDLMNAAAAAGARAGRQGDYWWIILTEEPFSFMKAAHEQKYRAMREAVGLDDIHAKFPRR